MVMIVLCILTIVLDTLGGLAVAMTMTEAQLDANLSTRVVVAVANIFDAHFHCGWLVYVIAFLLAAGVLAEISSWIVGRRARCSRPRTRASSRVASPRPTSTASPSRPSWSRASSSPSGTPVLCGSMALAGGSGSSISYLTAVGLTVVIYLVGYVLFFLAYFKLVFKGKDHARVFQIFGGTAGKCIVAGLGLILTVFALIVSFFPPSQLNASSGTVYVITLLVCWVISVAIPFVIYGLRKHWNGGVDHKPPTIPGKKERAAMATAADAPAPSASTPSPRPLPARKTLPPRTRPRRSDVSTNHTKHVKARKFVQRRYQIRSDSDSD